MAEAREKATRELAEGTAAFVKGIIAVVEATVSERMSPLLEAVETQWWAIEEVGRRKAGNCRHADSSATYCKREPLEQKPGKGDALEIEGRWYIKTAPARCYLCPFYMMGPGQEIGEE